MINVANHTQLRVMKNIYTIKSQVKTAKVPGRVQSA